MGGGGGVLSSGLSVLVNPKDPHAVQLGQLGDEDREQGRRVDHEVGLVVFGVEAGEYVAEAQINKRRRSDDYKGNKGETRLPAFTSPQARGTIRRL